MELHAPLFFVIDGLLFIINITLIFIEHGDERNAGLIAGLSIIICVGVIGILMMLICGIKCVIHKCLKHQKSYSKGIHMLIHTYVAIDYCIGTSM